MSVKHVKKVVEDFIADGRNDLLVIKGDWGVGKTYFWNEIVREASAVKIKSIGHKYYSYVSLFGLKNLEDVKTEIAASRINSESVKENLTAKEWAKDAKKILRDAEKLPILREKAGGALGTIMFRFMKDTLICFDDLERRGQGLDIKDVLGLASLLKEQRGCKIVFILNESVLLEHEKEEFRRHSEKVIDVEIEFSPEPEEVFNLIFSMENPHYDYIKDRCLKLAIRNIRILQRIRRFLESVSPHLKDVEAGTAQQVIGSLVLFIWCHYQKEKGAPPLSFVINFSSYDRLLAANKKDQADEEKQWSRTLDVYGYSHSDDLDQQLIRLVEVGFCDHAALGAQLAKKDEEIRNRKGKESYNTVWEIFYNSFDDNQQEFLKRLVASFRTNMKYLSLRDLQSTVQMARAFGQDEEANNLIDEFFNFHKDNPGLRTPLRGSERSDNNDEYLLLRLKEISSRFQDQRTLAEVVKKITDSRGWSPDDISLLANAEVEDYYDFFKSEKSEQLYYYIGKCLEFEQQGTNDGQTISIGSKAKEALIRLAKESAINKKRVSALYKIDIDDKPERAHRND